MVHKPNRFKAGLKQGQIQIGLWLSTGEPYLADVAGHAGFDWLVIDGEHGPNDLKSILAQLQVLESSDAEAVVRLPVGEKWMIKQMLDIGARTLLIPMVNSAEEAEELVRSVRYPPKGDRGMGAMTARASQFGAISNYVDIAESEICLLIQVETKRALADIERISRVKGIDGIFIGPADLAADMGGAFDSEIVLSAIGNAIKKIRMANRPAGILTFDEKLNKNFIDQGATFVAVGADVAELSRALRTLSARYGRGGAADLTTSQATY
ncbi:aldolase/citrate lyase family protein [Rhizorhapis suberifaciens]|uniref:4-hydroxy-2-oxoheptanedioate aldolase n=1 Tax=Rhizorhapis suberifaciens TaxID=13656 RepID=A0A840HVE9_9SPHN|nr:HpcH/HpaI aldolase/citrate lyase family protein [Rhizorhapis suberifaciens]MBB4641550.1 4-hydroxy-2-oxoheptanedioate aldolase [Rhizorhapis suberifaciens]